MSYYSVLKDLDRAPIFLEAYFINFSISKYFYLNDNVLHLNKKKLLTEKIPYTFPEKLAPDPKH